jgi:hypothetical protein
VQHRWKNNLDERLTAVFEDTAGYLKWAWQEDCKHPKSYPVNTAYAFVEIDREIADPNRKPKRVKLPRPRIPKTLLELVDERAIKVIYEDQNTGSYEEAIKEAYGFSGSRAWRKIWRAIDAAYFVRFGDEHAPKPRVHFLHRRLLELANSEPLTGLTLVGLLGFLDDLCPCGEKHKPDAIRKLHDRFANSRRR